MDWADLITVDLSLYETPEGKKELAQTLIKAVREDGFFYVKNFNIPQEAVNRQFSIGKQFYELPVEEKLKYVPEGLGMLSSCLDLAFTVSADDDAQIMESSMDMFPLGDTCM